MRTSLLLFQRSADVGGDAVLKNACPPRNSEGHAVIFERSQLRIRSNLNAYFDLCVDERRYNFRVILLSTKIKPWYCRFFHNISMSIWSRKV